MEQCFTKPIDKSAPFPVLPIQVLLKRPLLLFGLPAAASSEYSKGYKECLLPLVYIITVHS